MRAIGQRVQFGRRFGAWGLCAALALSCAGEGGNNVQGGDLGGLPSQVAQSIVEGGANASDDLAVTNNGDCDMTWSAAIVPISGGAWLTATVNNGPLPTVAAPATLPKRGTPSNANTVNIRYTINVRAPTALTSGNYQARLEIEAKCGMRPAVGSPAAVAFNLRVTPLDAVLVVGPDVATDVVTLSNNGAGTWRKLATLSRGIGFFGTTAVWTGREVLLFGGSNGETGAAEVFATTAHAFDPVTLTLSSLAADGMPLFRSGHSAVWTGNEMIVWGGRTLTGFATNTGGMYNPVSRQWRATSVTDPPHARSRHRAVWTGARMVVLGGDASPNDGTARYIGGRFDPSSGLDGTWSGVNPAGAATPSPERIIHATWTGRHVIWQAPGTGVKRYDPTTDSWTNASCSIGGTFYGGFHFSGTRLLGMPDTASHQVGTPFPVVAYDVARDRCDSLRPFQGGVSDVPVFMAWTGNRLIAITMDGAGSTGVFDPTGGGTWVVGPEARFNPPLLRTDVPIVWTGTQLLIFYGSDVYTFE